MVASTMGLLGWLRKHLEDADSDLLREPTGEVADGSLVRLDGVVGVSVSPQRQLPGDGEHVEVAVHQANIIGTWSAVPQPVGSTTGRLALLSRSVSCLALRTAWSA